MSARILVADDDRALQILLNVILSRAGYDVDFASDGRDALRKVKADHYDAIMLDLLLPEVSGSEILRRLAQEKPESLHKVIVLTGANHGVVDEVDTTQIRALVRKPFDIAEVIRLTAECASDS